MCMSLLLCIESLIMAVFHFEDAYDGLGVGVVWICWLLIVAVAGLEVQLHWLLLGSNDLEKVLSHV